ncbi:riboflavin kinase / FAD synthetase [Ancylostoma duodenale]|uniref:riboflavin kinase n=1 Tax=Ancylostoma duodenale TaxID=51022 RepID=A0A0C2GDD2_9BILA|nr:riboflavin kinase / FAD synthetase [Ancylostoma duodenale]
MIRNGTVDFQLLVSFLYQLLGLHAITNWIVHDAADCALSQIAAAMSLSVSEFLYERGPYIVHHIALAARSRTEHDHAPVVFSALLNRVDDPRMFEHVKHIVDDLLQALDNFKQEEIPSKEEVPSTEEEAIMESEKKPPPAPIQSVEAVLLRTKHLLSSAHLPVRILVMRILCEGLWVLRNFDDQLLPMVHQNWEALINRFRDEEMEVVTQMVHVSKTFVYRRVRHQMWPLIDKWMRDASQHLYSTTSATYKYQLCVLQSIAEIFIGIDAFSEDVQLVLAMLKLYCGKMGSPQLKKEAESAKRRLEEYVEERSQRTVANIEEPVVEALPTDFPCGVFYGLARVDGQQVDNMVMSIGWNPQYQNEKKTLEVHLLRKFDKDFYGSMMDVLILGFIRPMAAFNSLGELTSSLARN